MYFSLYFLYKQIKNQQVTTTQKVPTNVTFIIDEGLGRDTTVTVVTKIENEIDVLLIGPNGYIQRQSSTVVRILSLVVPGISEVSEHILARKYVAYYIYIRAEIKDTRIIFL